MLSLLSKFTGQAADRTDENPEGAGVLEFAKHSEGGAVFTVTPQATGQDVLSTLRHLEPQADHVQQYVEQMVQAAIESAGVLNNRTITIEEPHVTVDGVDITYQLGFGDSPTLDDLKEALQATVGLSGMREQLQKLLIEYVDKGCFAGLRIHVTNCDKQLAQLDPDLHDEIRRAASRYSLDGADSDQFLAMAQG